MQYASLNQSPSDGSARSFGSSRWSSYLSLMPDMMRTVLNQSPEMGWNIFSSMQGNDPNAYYGNWLSNQYRRYYGDYLTRAMIDPMYQWTDHLSTVDTQRDYANANPRDRGVYWGSYAPTMRMMR
jgi:hypothetical protein